MPKRKALDTLRAFLESSEIVTSTAAIAVLTTPRLASAKPGFVDRLIYAQLQERNAEMASFERAAIKLPGVTVL